MKEQTIQRPKEKGQTMIYKTLHRKLKIIDQSTCINFHNTCA